MTLYILSIILPALCILLRSQERTAEDDGSFVSFYQGEGEMGRRRKDEAGS